MRIHAHGQGETEVTPRRGTGLRIAVALFATAALCLGPAMAATADDTVVDGGSGTESVAPLSDVQSTTEEDQSSAGDDSGIVGQEENADGNVNDNSDENESEEVTTEETNEPVADDDSEVTDPNAEDAVEVPGDEDTQDGDVDDQALAKQSNEKDKDDKGKDDKDKGDHDVCQPNGDDEWPMPQDSAPSLASGGDEAQLAERKPGGEDPCNDKPKDPTIEIVTPDCLTWYDESSVELMANFGNLDKGKKYTVTVKFHGSTVVSEQFTASGKTQSWSTWVSSSGKYTIDISGHGKSGASASVHVKQCPKPEPEISVTPGDCIPAGGGEGAESTVEITATNLRPGHWYRITVGDNEPIKVKADGGGNAYASVSLTEPGWYTATVSDKRSSASTEFEVAECAVIPGLNVVVNGCVDNQLQAILTLQEEEVIVWDPEEEMTAKTVALVMSHPVTITGPSGFVWDGMLTAPDSATVVLGADGTYTAYVEGGEPIEFTATKNCPTTVTVVQHTPTPALAATGSDGGQPLLWAGALAMIAAALLMLEPVVAKRAKRSHR